jgi:subtilisin family serine protease
MSLKRLSVLKRYASCGGFLFLAACAQSSGGGAPEMCASAQDVSSAFQSVSAQIELKASSGRYELLVKLTNPGTEISEIRRSIAEVAAGNEYKFQQLNDDRVLIEFGANSKAKAVIEQFIADGKITALEQDQATYGMDDVPADELDSTDSATAVTPPLSLTLPPANPPVGPEIVVAIIDTGVDYTHKDLAQFMWKNEREVAGNGVDDDGNGYIDDVNGWDFVNNDNKPMADDTKSYHGTHVAGIVKQAALLAGNGVNLKIMALKYLDSTATGRTSNAIRAIDYAIKNGAVIMNNSWGSSSFSSALNEAIERARLAKILFTAAAGNGDANGVGINIDVNLFWPAAFAHDNVISVSATTAAGTLAGWSNYGAKNSDLGAPGVSILSARNGNTYAKLTGTSMATPFVSGVAAMLWGRRPDLSVNEIRKILFSTVTAAKSFTGKVTTGGTINWEEALKKAENYKHDPSDKGVSEIVPQQTLCNH